MKIRPQETKLIIVNANDKFGGYPILDVKKGEKYGFTVNPLNRWKKGSFSVSTKGLWLALWRRNSKRFKNANYLELCGTVGKELGYNDFRIGIALNDFEVPSDGPLFFFSNIGLNEYDKCSGNVIIKVQRIQ